MDKIPAAGQGNFFTAASRWKIVSLCGAKLVFSHRATTMLKTAEATTSDK